MGDIFNTLEKDTTDRLCDLKGIQFFFLVIISLFIDKMKIKDETLGAAFDYIKDEIDVRVKSVKIQIEELGIKAKEEVDKLRNEFLKYN